MLLYNIDFGDEPNRAHAIDVEWGAVFECLYLRALDQRKGDHEGALVLAARWSTTDLLTLQEVAARCLWRERGAWYWRAYQEGIWQAARAGELAEREGLLVRRRRQRARALAAELLENHAAAMVEQQRQAPALPLPTRDVVALVRCVDEMPPDVALPAADDGVDFDQLTAAELRELEALDTRRGELMARARAGADRGGVPSGAK